MGIHTLKGTMRNSRASLLLGLAIAMVAFNLRTIAVAVGPVLPLIRADLGMSDTVAGLLTSLPTLCFAVFGLLGPGLAQRIGVQHAILVALVANVAGQAARVLSAGTVSFMAATIAALAGIGVINVLLPPLVKHHFPTRNGLVTALYVTAQSVGLTLASLCTAPLGIRLTGWRNAFWVWAITMAAALPLLIWATVRFSERTANGRRRAITLRQVAGTRLGWMMAVFFGMQSAQAYGQFGWLPSIYQDAGFSAVAAGTYLGIVAAVGVPLSFVIPSLTTRLRNPVWLVFAMTGSGLLGYLGLIVDPRTLPWLWPCLLAVAGSCFPMILVLLGMRTRTPAGTAALSSFAQSAGYVLASFGPFLFGAVKDATGNYLGPLWIQFGLFLPLLVCAVAAIRSRALEDELGISAG